MMARASERGSRKENAGVVTYETAQQYFDRWKWLGPILDGIRFRELRAMTDEDRIRTLTSVTVCLFPRQCNDKSGWIAWQKVRERWMKKPKPKES